ncbi:MAG: cholest-4-en-3-one 26-monooxygenase, partial [Actinomycetota bacterium]|nr:cholest-4-en-3-one 26-monooxygenase [Actinomycetota bacterium]
APAERAGRLVVVDLYDPDSYVGAPPHEQLAELRRTQPVYFQDMADEPGYWMVLKHADLVHVAREPNLFSASEGGVMLENLAPEQLEMMRNMLLAMDPPRHVDYRRPIAPRFKARVIAGMEDQIRSICREIMATAAEKGDVEFVHDETSALPSRVIGQLMGLPPDDLPFIHRLAEMNTSSQDSDYASDVSQGTIDMAMYAIQFAATRRAEEPREDLTTLLLETDFNGHYMTDLDFGSFFVQLVTAGNDTTKTMLSSGLRALLDHPDQLADLRVDTSLVPGAVEEILRYENPLHYFRRTATADTELRDVKIAAGDKVVMFYTSANRDEEVFDDSQRFDIRRSPNPHLSFGIAEHFCLGVHLARLEGRVFFEELLGTFPTIEMTGEPVRIRSNLNNALKSLPVRLAR